MCQSHFWSWPKGPLWLTLPLFLSENLTYLTSFIEEIVCRNTCFECINNYNIWIIFYIFLWNYESIKVGVHLVFNTTSIWDWHRFTAVIWKNDTKRFIFPKLKMISVQNFEDNTTVLCTFCWTWCFFVDTRNGGHFVQNGHHFFIKFLWQGTCSKIIWSIFLSI